MVQGAGSSDLLQFSSDGLHWHSYRDLLPAIQPPLKVPPARAPWARVPPDPFVGPMIFVP